jgi:hypothetical protein
LRNNPALAKRVSAAAAGAEFSDLLQLQDINKVGSRYADLSLDIRSEKTRHMEANPELYDKGMSRVLSANWWTGLFMEDDMEIEDLRGMRNFKRKDLAEKELDNKLAKWGLSFKDLNQADWTSSVELGSGDIGGMEWGAAANLWTPNWDAINDQVSGFITGRNPMTSGQLSKRITAASSAVTDESQKNALLKELEKELLSISALEGGALSEKDASKLIAGEDVADIGTKLSGREWRATASAIESFRAKAEASGARENTYINGIDKKTLIDLGKAVRNELK